MNIALASDENYIEYLTVSVYSIMCSNKKSKINFFYY